MVFGKKKEYGRCQSCGNHLPLSKLKKCHTCGASLCRKCSKHHKCSILHIDENTGQVRLSSGHYNNPQCVIKITDMRIYELARNPSLMTEEEKTIIETDLDVRRRYNHYQEIIEEKGY